jgi:hypothetical protein
VHRALLLATALAAGCGSAPPGGPSPPAAIPEFTREVSTHFAFNYTPIDSGSISRTAGVVEAEHARITSDLRVDSMPLVSVFLYPDWDAMQHAVMPVVGPLPFRAKGLVTAVDRIHVLSPNLTGEWSYQEGTRAIVTSSVTV